jgi:hypothetical protein
MLNRAQQNGKKKANASVFILACLNSFFDFVFDFGYWLPYLLLLASVLSFLAMIALLLMTVFLGYSF